MVGKTASTILIVDYDAEVREGLCNLFSTAGYNVHGAADGQSAIRVARGLGTTDIDLMIVEMAQLDMSAGALIDAITVQQKKVIKVIASSALFSQADLDLQTAFRSDAGIRKEAHAIAAARWLLTAQRLLGEVADSAPPPTSQCVILLADDDTSVRGLVKSILDREGYQVLVSADGESALALARKVAAVDLVVTDIEMPKMDGHALGKAIRNLNSKVPVIFMSGNEDPVVTQLNDPAKGFVFLAKPFMPKALLDAVRMMMSRVKPPG